MGIQNPPPNIVIRECFPLGFTVREEGRWQNSIESFFELISFKIMHKIQKDREKGSKGREWFYKNKIQDKAATSP